MPKPTLTLAAELLKGARSGCWGETWKTSPRRAEQFLLRYCPWLHEGKVLFPGVWRHRPTNFCITHQICTDFSVKLLFILSWQEYTLEWTMLVPSLLENQLFWLATSDTLRTASVWAHQWLFNPWHRPGVNAYLLIVSVNDAPETHLLLQERIFKPNGISNEYCTSYLLPFKGRNEKYTCFLCRVWGAWGSLCTLPCWSYTEPCPNNKEPPRKLNYACSHCRAGLVLLLIKFSLVKLAAEIAAACSNLPLASSSLHHCCSLSTKPVPSPWELQLELCPSHRHSFLVAQALCPHFTFLM